MKYPKEMIEHNFDGMKDKMNEWIWDWVYEQPEFKYDDRYNPDHEDFVCDPIECPRVNEVVRSAKQDVCKFIIGD